MTDTPQTLWRQLEDAYEDLEQALRERDEQGCKEAQEEIDLLKHRLFMNGRL